ncbi:extensin-2-like [Melitaea cinxia]|uniref:extensin-2-like n=1 Tax=Melitaea cinxia TaxID=113334 RepID=UPI001E271C62|nr:extensin-2-like [Melitaea cinxia]
MVELPAAPSTTPVENPSNDTPTTEYASPPYEAAYYPYPTSYTMPAPQVIYVSPPQVASHPFSYAPPKPPPSPAPGPYHLESSRPLDPYRGYPAAAPKAPMPHYYEPYSYPSPPQHSLPPPYPPPSPYSWDYSSHYPEYRSHTFQHKPIYPAPAPTPLPPYHLPPYQAPPEYLPTPPYQPPQYYPKHPELPPHPYYAWT